jgi:hypothetical protein
MAVQHWMRCKAGGGVDVFHSKLDVKEHGLLQLEVRGKVLSKSPFGGASRLPRGAKVLEP